MELIKHFIWLFVVLCPLLANFPLASMQRAANSVPRLSKQVSRLAQPAVLGGSPGQGMKPVLKGASVVSLAMPEKASVAAQRSGLADMRNYTDYPSLTAVDMLTEEAPEKETLSRAAVALWRTTQQKNGPEAEIIEIEARLNRLKGYLDAKINIKEELENIKTGSDLYIFFTMIRDRYWNRGSYEIFTPHDLVATLDYLKNNNEKTVFLNIFNNLFESLNKVTTTYNGTVENGTFFGKDLKKELTEWFVKNPDYSVAFIQTLPGYLYSDNYSEDFILSVIDCVLPSCEKLINHNNHREEILNFFEMLTHLAQGNKHLLQEITLKLNPQEYPAIVKQLKDFNQSPPAKELLFIRHEYEKELDELKKMQERNKEKLHEHMQNPLVISSRHFHKLYARAPEEITKIKNSESYNQLIDALEAAVSLNNHGYYTFFHGQQNGYALLSDIGTELLYRLVELPKPTDFNFLRFRKNDFKRTEVSSEDAVSLTLQEQRQLMQSQNSGMGENFMALNLFAFAGFGVNGTYIPEYLESKYNVRPFHLDLLDSALSNLDIPDDITNKVAPLFKKLLEKNERAHSTGRLILVAVPSNIVNERLYLFKWMGNFIDSMRLPETIDKKIESLSIKPNQTFEDLNNLHCVMPMTPAGALNPYNDIKVLNFDSPIPASLSEEIKTMKQKLINEIINELKKEGKFEQVSKRARDYFNFLKEVHESEEKELTRK